MENVKNNSIQVQNNKNYFELVSKILTIVSYITCILYGSLWFFAIIDNIYGTKIAQSSFYQSHFMYFIIGLSYAMCGINIVVWLIFLIMRKIDIKKNKILTFFVFFNIILLAIVVFMSLIAFGQTSSTID